MRHLKSRRCMCLVIISFVMERREWVGIGMMRE